MLLLAHCFIYCIHESDESIELMPLYPNNLSKTQLDDLIGKDQQYFLQDFEQYKPSIGYLNQHPANCFKKISIKKAYLPAKVHNGFTNAYQLSCHCGNALAQLLEHYHQYNKKNQYGEKYARDIVTPTALCCSQCQNVGELFDIAVHG